MIIENIKTGQRFEVADGTHYPTHAYRIATPEPTPAAPTPSVVVPPKKPAAKKPAPKKKPAKKKTKKSKK